MKRCKNNFGKSLHGNREPMRFTPSHLTISKTTAQCCIYYYAIVRNNKPLEMARNASLPYKGLEKREKKKCSVVSIK